jgi:putrescine transport system ATP-binding protein
LSASDDPYVEIQRLNKSFGPIQALRDIDFTIRRGELFSLLGSSGCGKTTLLRALAGFVSCDSGKVLIGGRDVTALPPYLRPVNMMFQSYALFPHMTVEDNIAFGLRREGVKTAEIRKRVGEALDLIKMPTFARRMELIGIQQQLGITFVMVTHDQEEALTMSTRIAVMADGAVVQIGTPEDIYERPATRFVADFIGSVNLFDAMVTHVEAGMATVRCDALLGEIHLASRGFTAGDAVTLAIRPEQMRIAPATPPMRDARATGRVLTHAYVGDKRIYQLRLESGRVVQVSQPIGSHGIALLPRDTDVSIGWDSAASLLVGR